MSTIEQIIQDNGYTIKELIDCEKKGICNGFGPKGHNLLKIIRKIPYFKKDKEKKLLDDLDLIADIHDIQFNKGGGIKAFFKANYVLAYNIIKLLYWTNSLARLIIFIIVFVGTSVFGIRYFNWIKIL